MMKYLLSIDQGTTSTRCMLFDRSGKVVSSAQQEHRQIYPRPGWVEHDPLEIWERTQQVIRQAVAQAGLDPREIGSVGVTNQRETTIVWDRQTGQPFHNAIVWQDTRTKDLCDELMRQGGIDRFRSRTGLPLATYFSGPKLAWLLENIPGLRAQALSGDAIFGTVDSWLIWWLTGGPAGGAHVTDVTNASRTMLMDLQTLDWDAGILSDLGIPSQMLPRIVSSSAPSAYGDHPKRWTAEC